MILFAGITLGVIGKVLVIVAALTIHSRIIREQRIDSLVIREYRRERWLVVLGLFLIVLGYVLELRALSLITF